jgi:hypothetical protein
LLAIASGGRSLAVSRANIAQLVEQRFRKAWVAGSNPAVGSSFRAARCEGLDLIVNDLWFFEPFIFTQGRKSKNGAIWRHFHHFLVKSW